MVKEHQHASVVVKWDLIVKMNQKKQKKINKIKVEQVELSSFSYEKLTIDSYWDDLYNPKIYKRK